MSKHPAFDPAVTNVFSPRQRERLAASQGPTNARVSFYRLDTGEFTGQTASGPPEFLALNTPAGCGYVSGEYAAGAARVVAGKVERIPQTPSVDAARQALRAEVNRQARLRLASGVQFNGAVFQSDQDSRLAVLEQAVNMTPAERVEWKDAANAKHTFTQAQMRQLAAALQSQRAAVHAKADAIKQRIDAADTLAALEAFNIAKEWHAA